MNRPDYEAHDELQLRMTRRQAARDEMKAIRARDRQRGDCREPDRGGDAQRQSKADHARRAVKCAGELRSAVLSRRRIRKDSNEP